MFARVCDLDAIYKYIFHLFYTKKTFTHTHVTFTKRKTQNDDFDLDLLSLGSSKTASGQSSPSGRASRVPALRVPAQWPPQ